MEHESFRIGPFEPSRPPSGNGSANGHHSGEPRVRRIAAQTWPVLAGALAVAITALVIVPRLHFLNLALFNPWQRPVVAAAFGGLVCGLIRGRRSTGRPTRRRRTLAAAALGGALAGVAGLWLASLAVRAQVRVLFVDRSATRVILADLLRLAAYAVVPGALAALAAASGRAAASARRRTGRGAAGRKRDETPITEL